MSAKKGFRGAAEGLASLARFERIVAVLCGAIPVPLVYAGGGWDDVRDSISAYHDLGDARWFFVPLTAVAVLLVVNGLVRSEKHGYNALLGAGLAVLTVFDHDGASKLLHYAGVTLFFGGNVFVMLYLSKGVPRGWRLAMVGALCAVVLLRVLVDAFTTFWAEWVSLLVIATHFLLASLGKSWYRDPSPHERSDFGEWWDRRRAAAGRR